MIKKILLQKMIDFPEPYTRSKNKIKVELDLSYYATKPGLKIATGVQISDFAKEADLTTSKSDVDGLDIYKSETILPDLSTLNNVIKNDIVKKDGCV